MDETSNLEPEEVASNDSDSDQDGNDEDVREKKKRHHRTAKISKEERAEAKKKEALTKHPLNVSLCVKIPDGTALNLVFSYLVYLKIVVVKFSMNHSKPITGVSAADVLDGDCVLNELYIGDTGNDSPHPASSYLLKAAGITEAFSHFIPEVGRPYIWAQRMCGLDFMTAIESENKDVKNVQLCPSLSVATVENFIFTIQRRLKSRVKLMKELQDLESGKILTTKETSTIRLSGSLTQWQSVSWSEYNQSPSTTFLVSEGVVNPDSMLYRAIITRQSAKLVALVAVSTDYPKKAPLFSLTLHYNGTHNNTTSDDIRDIERVVNTDWQNDDSKHYSLSHQIQQLLICLDILLESMGTTEFPPDKVMLQPVRGKNRMKPYKFIKQGAGIFVQF